MRMNEFIAIGENIHCTRIYKVGGSFCRRTDAGYAIAYQTARGSADLPVPGVFVGNADWEAGRVKHCAVAIWQGNYGDAAGREAGVAYLRHMAAAQAAAGAKYLDINLDEFSTDIDERVRLMKWTVGVVQAAATIPVSIDSSNTDILRAGLEAADPARGRPMVNSVSLERVAAIGVAAAHRAAVIASAAGERDLPQTVGERASNFAALMERLRAAGFADDAIYLDPLVFPISTDSQNGVRFLESVSAARKTYGPRVHIAAGLSNVSFGMPSRKLINQVFARLAVEAGADGGIVDPLQINGRILAGLDTNSEAYRLARDLLTGADEFGANFIAASREGKV